MLCQIYNIELSLLHPAATAYTVAAVSPTVEVASAVILTIVTVMCLLSGFMIREQAVPVSSSSRQGD